MRIEDHGPYVDGRVVDLSPKVADELDMRKRGVAPVVIAPVTVPQPNGEMKLGAGAVPGALASTGVDASSVAAAR